MVKLKIYFVNNVFFFTERALIISDQQETFIVDSPPESSDREVSPKLVVGTKKYGRRSRPQTQRKINEPQQQQQASDSEDSNDDQDSHRGCSTQQVKRSTSQTDIPGTRRRCTTGVTESKLKRCASLPAQRNLFNQNKPKMVANKGNMSKDTLMPISKNTLSSSVESLGKYFYLIA